LPLTNNRQTVKCTVL